MALKHKTPLLDELESGPWPSFVTDMKRMAETKPECDDLLGVMELSYVDKECHWKHGGVVGVMGYGGGVIGRYCDRPDLFPEVAHFHTVRVNQPTEQQSEVFPGEPRSVPRILKVAIGELLRHGGPLQTFQFGGCRAASEPTNPL